MCLFIHILQSKYLLPCPPLHSTISFELFIQLTFAELLQGSRLWAKPHRPLSACANSQLSGVLFISQESFLLLRSEVPTENIISHDRMSFHMQTKIALAFVRLYSFLNLSWHTVWSHLLHILVTFWHTSWGPVIDLSLIFLASLLVSFESIHMFSPHHDLNFFPGRKSDACFSIHFPSANKDVKETIPRLGKEAQLHSREVTI